MTERQDLLLLQVSCLHTHQTVFNFNGICHFLTWLNINLKKRKKKKADQFGYAGGLLIFEVGEFSCQFIVE